MFSSWADIGQDGWHSGIVLAKFQPMTHCHTGQNNIKCDINICDYLNWIQIMYSANGIGV